MSTINHYEITDCGDFAIVIDRTNNRGIEIPFQELPPFDQLDEKLEELLTDPEPLHMDYFRQLTETARKLNGTNRPLFVYEDGVGHLNTEGRRADPGTMEMFLGGTIISDAASRYFAVQSNS